MGKTFEQGQHEITAVCRYFTTNRQAFLAPGVKEAHVRQTLIGPFFDLYGLTAAEIAVVEGAKTE